MNDKTLLKLLKEMTGTYESNKLKSDHLYAKVCEMEDSGFINSVLPFREDQYFSDVMDMLTIFEMACKSKEVKKAVKESALELKGLSRLEISESWLDE